MNLEAQHNYIVIEVDRATEGRLAGLLLPESARPAIPTGIVRSIGPQARVDIRVGDRVLFPPYGIGEEVMFGGVRYMIMLDHEILGIVAGES
jgi:co-chaperonin GroES (HSP10)